MLHVDLKPLVGKLNETCRGTLEGAAALCLSRTNYNVEVEHWLFKLLETTDTDVAAALRHFEIDASRVCKDVSRTLDRLKTGNARISRLLAGYGRPDPRGVAGRLDQFRRDQDPYGTRPAGPAGRRYFEPRPARRLAGVREALGRGPPQKLHLDYGRSAEAEESKSVSGPAAEGAKRPEGGGDLDKYTIDLTARARRGEIDPSAAAKRKSARSSISSPAAARTTPS